MKNAHGKVLVLRLNIIALLVHSVYVVSVVVINLMLKFYNVLVLVKQIAIVLQTNIVIATVSRINTVLVKITVENK